MLQPQLNVTVSSSTWWAAATVSKTGERLGDDLGADAVARYDRDAMWSHRWVGRGPEAAVDGERGARDPARLVRCEVDERVGDVARLAEPTQRVHRLDAARAPAGSSWPASQRSSIGVATKPGEPR